MLPGHRRSYSWNYHMVGNVGNEASKLSTSPRQAATLSPAGSKRSLLDVQLELDLSGEGEVTDGSSGVSPVTTAAHEVNTAVSTNTLTVPSSHSSNLMKSASTPAIPSINDEERKRACEQQQRRSGTISEGVSESSHGQEDQDEDEILNAFLQQEKTTQAKQAMIHFLNDPSNFEDDDFADRPKPVKEEKKRRHSVFSKLGSYRQKKLVKDSKPKSTHHFVSVSFSNSTNCDVCNKSMANKDALQCENCMVNVHESYCKDQIAQCTKFRHPKLLHNRDSMRDKITKYQSSSLPGGSGVSVKSTQSFKERRAASVPSRPQYQSTGALHRQGSPSSGLNGSTIGTSGYFQWRRVATKLGIDKVISEERENLKDKDVAKESETLSPAATTVLPDGTNITETISVSMESLDEGAAEVNDFDDEDPDLMIKGSEAEAWSVTVDKKTLKKKKVPTATLR